MYDYVLLHGVGVLFILRHESWKRNASKQASHIEKSRDLNVQKWNLNIAEILKPPQLGHESIVSFQTAAIDQVSSGKSMLSSGSSSFDAIVVSAAGFSEDSRNLVPPGWFDRFDRSLYPGTIT
jgi:hypothetical protein